MSRNVIIASAAAGTILVGMLALPYITVADATGSSAVGDRDQRYRTCYMKERIVFDGETRLERVPHCVFTR